MAVRNVHERLLPAGAGDLIDELSSPGDRLWPGRTWPPMRLDGPLQVGAAGGHGPIRYTVESYVQGEWARFRLTGPRGVHGFHEFTRHECPGGTVLRHTLVVTTRGPARLTWPLVFRPLHDALLEDLLDCAEIAMTGSAARPARWSPYVRLLRRIGRTRGRPSRALDTV